MKNKLTIFMGAILIILSGILTYLVLVTDQEVKILYQQYSDEVQMTVFPYVFELSVTEKITKQPEVELVDPLEYPDGLGWLIHKVSDGSPEIEYTTNRLTYNRNDILLSEAYVPNSLEIKEVEPILYSYGSPVKIGAYFISKWATQYGTNCVGCNVDESGVGGTSAGIMMGLRSVRQSNGTWLDGITYDGYYIIAADKAIPLCTVVEISDHRFSGAGLEAGVPFKAIVLDRGGAIKGSDIDLFAGDETNPLVRNGRRSGMKVEIVGFRSRGRNSLGERVCSVNG